MNIFVFQSKQFGCTGKMCSCFTATGHKLGDMLHSFQDLYWCYGEKWGWVHIRYGLTSLMKHHSIKHQKVKFRSLCFDCSWILMFDYLGLFFVKERQVLGYTPKWWDHKLNGQLSFCLQVKKPHTFPEQYNYISTFCATEKLIPSVYVVYYFQGDHVNETLRWLLQPRWQDACSSQWRKWHMALSSMHTIIF